MAYGLRFDNFCWRYPMEHEGTGLTMACHNFAWYRDVFNGVKKPGGLDYSGVFPGTIESQPCGQEPYTTYANSEPSPARLAESIAHDTYGEDEVKAWYICLNRERRFLEDAYYTQKKIFLDAKQAAIDLPIQTREKTQSYLRDLLKPANLNEKMDSIRTYIVQKLESKGMMPTFGADAKKELVDSIVTSALTRLQNYVLDEYTSGIPGVSRSSTTRSREVNQSLSAGSSGGGMTSTGIGIIGTGSS